MPRLLPGAKRYWWNVTARWRWREKASEWCQQETSPQGEAMLYGVAQVSSNQMDHDLFQVPSAEYKIQLREWPQGSAMARKHEALKITAGCCQSRYTASYQVSSGGVVLQLEHTASCQTHPKKSCYALAAVYPLNFLCNQE